jgi:hypothetical protein
MTILKSNNETIKATINSLLNKFDDIKLDVKDEEEIEEWLKCQNDFFYFLRTYVQLDLPGFENEFKYHPGQEITIRTLMEYHYAIVLKSRQIGITTVIRAYCAWLTIFFENYSIGVISKKGPDATAFVRKTIKLLEDLPPFLRPVFSKKTEQQYILENNSLLMAEAVSPSQPENALRSNPIVFLIIDEGAFIHKIQEALSGLLPTTVTVQRAAKAAGIPYGVLFISTPNKTKGTGKWFFEQYKQAVINNLLSSNLSKGAYKAIKLHWKDLGEPFDEEWYDDQCKVLNHNEEDIAQEIDCVFLPNVKNGLVEKDKVINMSKNEKEPVEYIETEHGQIAIFDDTFHETKHERRFVLCADTATSTGMKTFSSFIVMDFDTDEQIMEYVGKLNVFDYPDVIKKALEAIGDNVFIIIEKNTIGESVVESIYRDSRWGSKVLITVIKDDKGKLVRKFPGIETQGKSKPLFIESLTDWLKENSNKVFGERSVMQITTVDVKDGRLIGTPNDLVMCFAFYTHCKRNNYISFSKTDRKSNEMLSSPLDGVSEKDVIDYVYDRGSYVREKLRDKKDSYSNIVDFLNND